MQAKSKNLIIGCIATMAIVATISTVHGHVCLDKPFTSHESHALKGILYFLL